MCFKYSRPCIRHSDTSLALEFEDEDDMHKSAPAPSPVDPAMSIPSDNFSKLSVHRLTTTAGNRVADNQNSLSAGRPQGPAGPVFASKNFRTAVPDLHLEVEEMIIVSDRV